MFATDLNLHSYGVNESCSPPIVSGVSRKNMSDLRQAPSVKKASIKSGPDAKEYDWNWLEDESSCKSKLSLLKQFINFKRKKMT